MVADVTVGPNEARVLAALDRTEVPLTGRAVARITGLTQSAAQRTLTRLREAGLVVAEPAPPSLLYRVNREHLALPPLLALLRVDDEFRARAVSEVGRWLVPPVSLVVYGSAARGEASAGSDLDLLVVRADTVEPDEPTWQEQIAELAGRLQRWTGRRASVIEMSKTEAIHGLRDGEPFLVEAEREGLQIAGTTLGELAGSRT